MNQAAHNPRNIRVTGAALYFLPVRTRVPLKFGTEALTSVTCARACIQVVGEDGRTALGWGETPLSVQWVWPSALPYAERHAALTSLATAMARAWSCFELSGHPLEIACAFQRCALHAARSRENERREEAIPWLAALVCCSPFDLALYDAYGNLHGRGVYETLQPPWLNQPLEAWLEPAEGCQSLTGRFPADFLVPNPPLRLPAWHLVGGLDPLDVSELTGEEPDDGYPVTLPEWIERDGLRCLKIKLRGTDSEWDYDRIVRVAAIGESLGVERLSVDFNCTVTDPAYVNEILDRLRADRRRTFERILYVEQPFPYDLEQHEIDVRSVAERKPLFMDESAHDWRLIRLGRERGWSGVALKTCKTQTGAILSLCWARAHGMDLMVQDLTNPMLAQIPHVLLAAHAGTIHGVETNAMQFYPQASAPEAAVHPGLYTRRNGCVDLSTIRGPGFGYRLPEISRELPPPVFTTFQ